MQTLGLHNSANTSTLANASKKRFWEQQVYSKATTSQKAFDWIFGVFLPVICFVFDPIVFKGGFAGRAILGNYAPFAYLLSFVSVMAMAAWLIWGEKLKWFNGFLGGLFLLGGFISICVGVVMLPYTIMGLFIVIGVLGFTPFFSFWVYWRNAFRAINAAKPLLEKGALIYAVAFGAIFSLLVLWTINSEIKKSSGSYRIWQCSDCP